jgi:hypothetical protein
MGCTVSSGGALADELNQELWEMAETTAEKRKIAKDAMKVTYSTWRTIRIYSPSVFKEFRSERELLQTKFRPALQTFCENRKLIFIFEDFNGVI